MNPWLAAGLTAIGLIAASQLPFPMQLFISPVLGLGFTISLGR